MTSRHTILSILQSADAVISGETLSARLGISRVSVWKHIQGLIQQGVPIVATSKGYRLADDPDTLMPWAFGDLSECIHYFPETPSTMDEAMRLARSGCPEFTTAVAQRQVEGRGRMRRAWASDEGGLYFTVVIRPEIPIVLAGLVNLAAAVEMAALLRDTYGVAALPKWPNDVLVDEKKICGILSQMEVEGDQVGHINIGVGLNVNNRPENHTPTAVSLKTLMGAPVPRRDILLGFLARLKNQTHGFDPDAVISAWKKENTTLGRKVRVVTLKETVEGLAVDLDDQGGLVLREADGRLRTVIYGDCFQC
ncbi:biotin--[acetyl-CoA-carboxylase] ligase [Desulfosarcina sp. OttesenSCG-928-B08]|nr:biotin--[acetyl-CoA-carboxylase] ligase [Desulfosarcina sp. OttesenSCG-928-B08]